jgi:hypothetical protein
MEEITQLHVLISELLKGEHITRSAPAIASTIKENLKPIEARIKELEEKNDTLYKVLEQSKHNLTRHGNEKYTLKERIKELEGAEDENRVIREALNWIATTHQPDNPSFDVYSWAENAERKAWKALEYEALQKE